MWRTPSKKKPIARREKNTSFIIIYEEGSMNKRQRKKKKDEKRFNRHIMKMKKSLLQDGKKIPALLLSTRRYQ